MAMSKCKHENADHVKAGEQYALYDRERGETTYREALVEQFRCVDCSAWLSLGPSDETDPRVALELRAATLSHTTFSLLIDCENCGWEAHDDIDTDHDRDCQYPWPERDGFDAGYLARCIANHDKEQP
jgi:hypothetical protein